MKFMSVSDCFLDVVLDLLDEPLVALVVMLARGERGILANQLVYENEEPRSVI
jgi:hypothetical protein